MEKVDKRKYAECSIVSCPIFVRRDRNARYYCGQIVCTPHAIIIDR